MLQHPQFDPVAIAIGPLKIHWYGLTYLVGFAAGWWLGRLRSRKPWSPLQEEQVDDLRFYMALGVICLLDTQGAGAARARPRDH